jgi:predicted amidohydrolase YtcJ
VPMEAALGAYTAAVAHQAFADRAAAPWGRIVPGASADLVWLARDPRTVEPHELPAVEVRETYLAGAARLAASAHPGTTTPARPDTPVEPERSVALRP